MNTRSLRTALLFALLVPACRAQLSDFCTATYIPRLAAQTVTRLQNANAITPATDNVTALKETRDNFSRSLIPGTTVAACFAAANDAKSLAIALEERRIDKQVGASGGGSGSTNLVPSGSVPALLGLAVEYGGINESFNGTTVTFRTTPAKLLASFAKAYGPDAPPPDDATLAALERVSLSVSFDTSRTDTASSPNGNKLLANYQQLSPGFRAIPSDQ